jgi:hypothetical protein
MLTLQQVADNPTKQNIFDFVVQQLRKQEKPSFDPSRVKSSDFDSKILLDNGCLYRKYEPDGTILKCAAGHLIPDDEYNPRIENTPIFEGLSSYTFQSIRDNWNNTIFIGKLQDIHDKYWDEREEKWMKLATQYNLDYQPLESA